MRGRVASFIYFPATLQALYCFITTHFFKVWIEKKGGGGGARCSEPATGLLTGQGGRPENLACLLPALGQVPQFPRASPLLQGLSSPTHSLPVGIWIWEQGGRNMVKNSWLWHYGWICAEHRAEPDAKESKTANAWLSSHIHWPCPSGSHWKKFTSTYFSY